MLMAERQRGKEAKRQEAERGERRVLVVVR